MNTQICQNAFLNYFIMKILYIVYQCLLYVIFKLWWKMEDFVLQQSTLGIIIQVREVMLILDFTVLCYFGINC